VKSHELTEPTCDSALRKKQIEKCKLFGNKRQLQQSPNVATFVGIVVVVVGGGEGAWNWLWYGNGGKWVVKRFSQDGKRNVASKQLRVQGGLPTIVTAIVPEMPHK